MTQQTLARFAKYGKAARRARFMAEMEQVLLWDRLLRLIEPFYPRGGGSVRAAPPPVPGSPLESQAVHCLVENGSKDGGALCHGESGCGHAVESDRSDIDA